MLDWWEKNFATCDLGDIRLNERAMSIGYAISQGFGKALSESVFIYPYIVCFFHADLLIISNYRGNLGKNSGL
ncbi:IS4/Tn5 family transposase DNA-binding protein [Nostoc favosum]|uniref:Transposase n=1 Tax=Nostoc favosum CHAB5714 TaxID=2780399 RepID=A0ABS8INI3_9NOSO|nr:transposase [Nostoc favosum]MCC5604897.1 transposase [Nostoc favosum CHAB5714]